MEKLNLTTHRNTQYPVVNIPIIVESLNVDTAPNGYFDYLKRLIQDNYISLYSEMVGGPLIADDLIFSIKEISEIQTQLILVLWLHNPYAAIRGMPSPLNSLTITRYYDHVAYLIAHYLLVERFKLIEQITQYSWKFMVHHEYSDRTAHSTYAFKFTEETPLASLAIMGLIIKLIDEYAPDSAPLRKAIEDVLFPSKLAQGNLADQETLLSQYIELIFIYIDYDHFRQVTTNIAINHLEIDLYVSDLLYNRSNPGYQNWSAQLDELRINWRQIPTVCVLFTADKILSKEEIGPIILDKIRSYLVEYNGELYAPGAQSGRARESIDLAERRNGTLSESFYQRTYPELERMLFKWSFKATDEQIHQVLQANKDVLEYDETDAKNYTREQLIDAMISLGSYLPKRNLGAILGM